MAKHITSESGARRFKGPVMFVLALFIAFILGRKIAGAGIVMAAGLLVLPFIVYYVFKIFTDPRTAMIIFIALAFFAIGLLRYLPVPLPLGLTIDGVLFLALLGMFLVGWKDTDWSKANHFLTKASFVWMAYVFIELVNPEAHSPVAWFYAMRGIALYQLLAIPIILIGFNRLRDMDTWLKMWAAITILAAMKGLMQLVIGPDPFEQKWLDSGNDVTHILFGKLRVFSFYSDAGQYGAAMAHAFITFGIIAAGPGVVKKRVFFGVASFLAFIGMMISGTRGALAVPAAGVFAFLILSKNFRLFIIGSVAAFAIFFVLKYTFIAHGNAQVRRMRTALDPNNPSFQVRLRNQAKLRVYLASRPLGGGIGTAGSWGLRFSPNTFLAQTPTDSWFVKIWAETGIIGLTIHFTILLFILLKSSWITWHIIKNKEILYINLGLIAGYTGIMLASYGNGIFGQMPTYGMLIFSWVFLALSPYTEKEKLKWLPENRNLLTVNGKKELEDKIDEFTF